MRVEFTPTFLGCPALEVMRDAMAEKVRELGGEPDVRVISDDSWSSDKITPEGREKLRVAGLAPPAPREAIGADAPPAAVLGLPLPVLRLDRHEAREHLRPDAVPVGALLQRLPAAVRAVQDDLIDVVTRGGAAVGSLVFTVGEPGVMGVLVPYLLTGWDGSDPPLALQVAGAALLAAGAGVLAHTVIRFAVEGLGTPFPAAPTENLVVGGLYRYVRNPMYLAVLAIILGQAAILGRVSAGGLRRGLLGHRRGLRQLLRGADPVRALRRAVRRLPPCGQALVAAGDTLERLTFNTI